MSQRVYEEVVDFIAAGPTPQAVIEFRLSDSSRDRFWQLVQREKAGNIDETEKSELDHFMQVEHIMRLAKARARSRIQTVK